MNKNNNNALLAKLDALIEQVKLTNALLGAQVMSYEVQKRLNIELHWEAPEHGEDAPELPKKEYLTLQGLYRIVDDEAH
ncbi:MAG: hypothetical protein IJ667_07180 [Synergistaceae bacterium]|nr:hypothetical protein [Synergistaceae bacterium]